MVRSTRGKWLFPELNHSVTSATYRLHVSPCFRVFLFPVNTASGTAPIFRSQRTVFTLFRGWKHEVGTSGTKAFSTFQGRLWSNPTRLQFNFQSRLRGSVRKVQAIFDSRALKISQIYPRKIIVSQRLVPDVLIRNLYIHREFDKLRLVFFIVYDFWNDNITHALFVRKFLNRNNIVTIEESPNLSDIVLCDSFVLSRVEETLKRHLRVLHKMRIEFEGYKKIVKIGKDIDTSIF